MASAKQGFRRVAAKAAASAGDQDCFGHTRSPSSHSTQRSGTPTRESFGQRALWLSFDLFDAIEGGDAQIAESQRLTVLLVVVVIFTDDSRLPPSSSDRPTDSDGSSCHAHEFERPLRMLLVK